MPLAPTPFKYFCLGCQKAVAKRILSVVTDGGEIACAKHQKELEENPELKRYATFFNKVDMVVGSGPYTFDSWKPNEKVTIREKKSWWGYNSS